MDGMNIITKVRGASDIPIIVLSARNQEEIKVNALDYGADDYLTKPFSVEELSARIRVAFRYINKLSNIKIQKKYSVGDLELNTETKTLLLQKEEIHVTPMEYKILVLFFQNQGKLLTSEFITNEIYQIKSPKNTQALRSLIAGLRRKIEKNSGKTKYIIRDTAGGYRLSDKL